MNPIRSLTCFACLTTSYPSTRALPLVGVRSVERILIVVVLPAPLGPSSPNTPPFGARIVKSVRAAVSRLRPGIEPDRYMRQRLSHSMA